MRLSTVLKIAGVGIVGYVGYRMLVRRQAKVSIGYIPGEGSLTSPGWNDGLYLGPEQTAMDGRGSPAVWRTSEYIPSPMRSISKESIVKVWLPSTVFGQQNPAMVQERDTLATVADKVYQDASRPSSQPSAMLQRKSGSGPRNNPPMEYSKPVIAAKELGRAAGKLQNDVMFRATGLQRGRSSSRTVSAIFDKEMK